MTKQPILKPDWKEMRRFRALDLHNERWTQIEIAEALGVSKMAVSKWVKAFREQGSKALQTWPHLGAATKLTHTQLEAIPELLSSGAESYGFRGNVWTCQRIAQVINLEYGVSYHKAHISRILKELNWTPQKPMTLATQRNEQEIARRRSEVWPSLKKKRSRNSAALFA